PQPQVAISGNVIAAPAAPASVQWMLQHQSLPLAALLKKMNRYSNNPMADMIAATVGGAQVVAQKAIAETGVPAAEIQLVNGSGLAPENRMSPRAVCALFLAIERLVKPQGLTIADIFSVIGQDESVLDRRPLPKQAVLKSGTLDTVSTLAGALPTQKAGAIWFVLMNNEGSVESFRNLQERFLSTVQQTFGGVSTAPIPTLEPSSSADAPLDYTQQWSPL
ncbi:MAG TPA: D-alanyl-D-alanine carboxypeptidase, partial [Stenomitos sp.]